MAQVDSVQNLLFVRKGKEISFRDVDYKPGSNAFYLYRSCFYDFVLTKGKTEMCKVTDIRNDSIYYTKQYIHEEDGSSSSGRYDTLSMHPAAIKKIRVTGGLFPIPVAVRMKKYNYSFITSDSAKKFRTGVDKIYGWDSGYYYTYEVIPYMNASINNKVYEQIGELTRVRPPKPNPFVKEPEYVVRNVIWFTPSNVNAVRGINISLQTMTLNSGSLAVTGVNVGADLVSAFLWPYVLSDFMYKNKLKKMPDTIDMSPPETIVRGLHASFGGFAGDEISGLALNGLISFAVKANGIVITGMANELSQFKGIVISTLGNKSIKGAGLQVGLFNTCKHLKGVQIGLWNVNSKRKLPFINWCFKSTDKKSG